MRKLTNPWETLSEYHCFGCAPHNSAGVKMEFYENGDEIVSIWKPQPQFQGWLNTLHGGIQSVLLDEICAWVVLYQLQTTGVTSKMETRFRKAVSTQDKYLILKASIVEQRRNLITINALLYNQAGVICTEATCTYFTFSKEKSKEMFFRECTPFGSDLTLEEIVKNSD